jgi:signal transduction histidine kinase
MRPASPPPPPWRSAGSGTPSGADLSPHAASHGGTDLGGESKLGLEFFSEALDAAMILVHADSGELATLDDSHQRLVLRARRTRPRLEHSMSGFGSMGPISGPGRPSQPLHPLPTASAIDAFAGIDQQSTDLLPGVLLTRMYRRGERLIGHTWQRGEPVIMRGEECRALPGGTAPADPEAPWHLAVPIFRPGPLIGQRTSRQIIGVIAVHNRDPLWSFSAHDVELLTLHADRVASSMKANELGRLNEVQAALLEVLRGAGRSMLDLPNLYVSVRDVVRQLMDAPSFALVLCKHPSDEVTFALAERDEQALTPPPFLPGLAPRWWSAVRNGHTICVSAPEDRAAHPEYCVLGFGSDEPVQSVLAAPLMVGQTPTGAIVVGSPRVDAYPPEHVRLFETVARSAAIVIENVDLADEKTRSLQQARAKAAQLSVLNNAVLTLNGSLDLPTTLNALVRQAKGLTNAQVCTVFLLDDSGQSFVARASNLEVRGASIPPELAGEPESQPVDEVRIPLGWRQLNQLLANQHYVIWDDLESDWDDATPLGRMLSAERVYEALILPVAHQGSPLGALWVYTPGQRQHFPAEEISLLEGLAGQAAIAISNARLFQQLERAYEKQKELDRYKDEFILTVSHEFRTPLTAIDGYVSLISRHGQTLAHEKLEQFAQEIRTSTSQLASMISMLADANRMSSQPLQLTLRPLSVLAVAETAITQQPPESRGRLRNHVPRDLVVPADQDRLTLVISNLLSNALKYSPPDEPVELTARLETREALARAGRAHALAEGAPERWVVISASDHGEGISREDQARLFQKFVRLSRSLVTSVRGTGLGLWICRQYIEAMGGDIWVESTVGEGSTFRFCLPAASASPEA